VAHIKKSIFLVAWVTAVGNPALQAGGWEEKEKYYYLDEHKAKKKNTKIQKILQILSPITTTVEIEPSLGNRVVGGRGTRIEISPNAFADAKNRIYSEKVRIQITEVVDPIDFVAAGVDLTYYPEKNKREFFKSAGMFKIEAFSQRGIPLALAPGKKINVEFPNVTPGNEFFVYHHDADKNWKLHGHNQSTNSDREIRVGTRRYTIDALNVWWNFDKPMPEAACAKGKVRRADGKEGVRFSVYSVGVSYKGAFARTVSESQSFKVNVHKSSQARFLVIDNEGAVGITPVTTISDRSGFDQADEGPNNYCQDIGNITLEQLDDAVITDKKRLSEFLGLPVTEYKVDYQNRPAGP
jgi:hypothetical protein